MTNREWLESLSDKELAQFIRQISTCYAHNFDCETCVLGSVKVCENQQELEQWLKAERSENE